MATLGALITTGQVQYTAAVGDSPGAAPTLAAALRVALAAVSFTPGAVGLAGVRAGAPAAVEMPPGRSCPPRVGVRVPCVPEEPARAGVGLQRTSRGDSASRNGDSAAEVCADIAGLLTGGRVFSAARIRFCCGPGRRLAGGVQWSEQHLSVKGAGQACGRELDDGAGLDLAAGGTAADMLSRAAATVLDGESAWWRQGAAKRRMVLGSGLALSRGAGALNRRTGTVCAMLFSQCGRQAPAQRRFRVVQMGYLRRGGGLLGVDMCAPRVWLVLNLRKTNFKSLKLVCF